MHTARERLVLVVDDEASVRNSLALVLRSDGYAANTAEGGFDALRQLRRVIPDVIVSDLNMPQMSGFEFLSIVRRRFPEIPVVAISGAYKSGDSVPGGVIADAFYPKGNHRPEELLQTIADLIRTREERATSHRQLAAPVWIPRNGKDSRGVPFIVLTCTECLRSFPLSVMEEGIEEIQVTPCLFCASAVRYVIDFSVGVNSPLKTATEKAVGGQKAPANRESERY